MRAADPSDRGASLGGFPIARAVLRLAKGSLNVRQAPPLRILSRKWGGVWRRLRLFTLYGFVVIAEAFCRERRAPHAAASARALRLCRIQAPRSARKYSAARQEATRVGFGTAVLPPSQQRKIDQVCVGSVITRTTKRLKKQSCLGAAQLTVEADERLDSGPAGRAGYIIARRTASRRLQTLPPKKRG